MTTVHERPHRGCSAVVEQGLAEELHLDGAFEALDRAYEEMLRVIVRRRPRVRGDRVLVIGRPHRQGVADDHPPGRGLPRGDEDIRAGLVVPGGRMVDVVRCEAERARLAVEQAAEDTGRVEAWHAEPVDRAVGCNERASVAVGQERVVRDRGERRRRRSALRRRRRGRLAHRAIHGPCQPPCPRRGPRLPSAPRSRVHRPAIGPGVVEKRLHHPPCLLDRVLSREAKHVSDQRRVEEHLVRRRPFPSLSGELHVELDRPRPVLAVRLDDESYAGRGVELDDQLVRHDLPVERRETKLRRMLEDEPKLRLGDGKPLSGSDVEGNARPAPVLDIEPERGIRLGRRVGRDASDVEVAVVLAADVVATDPPA